MKLISGISIDRKSGWISFPESVSVLSKLDDKLVLISQLRPNSRTPTPELPGGQLETGENAIMAACRELSEEAGLEGREAIVHLTLDMDLSASYHRTHLVEVSGTKETDEEYEFERHLVGVEQARELVADGKITHAPTVVAILGFFK